MRFETANLKIERANRHIQELESAILEFVETDICTLRVDQDAQTGQCSVYVESVKQLPPEMSLTIGDAVHNLRAALDHAIVQILGKRGKNEAFPVAKERDNPGSHSTYRLIKENMPELAALLVEKIAIYDTGDASLWAISKLDNIDKHNLLIVTGSVQKLTGFSFANEERNIRVIDATAVIGQGGRLGIASIPGPVQITDKGRPSIVVLFGKGEILAGRPILPSLKKMAELTLQAIQTLELFWFRQGQKG